MPTAEVKFKTLPHGTALILYFLDEDAKLSFTQKLRVTPNLPGSISDKRLEGTGTLSYGSLGDLFQLKEYRGTIGPAIIDISFTNGTKLTGSLVDPLAKEHIVKVSFDDDDNHDPPIDQTFGQAVWDFFGSLLKQFFRKTYIPVHVDNFHDPDQIWYDIVGSPQVAMGVIAGSPATQDDAHRFEGKFDLAGDFYSVSGHIDPNVAFFECSEAMLTYSHTNQLCGTFSYRGTLGPKAFSFVFENGLVINGVPKEARPAVTASGYYPATVVGCAKFYGSDGDPPSIV